MSSATVRHKVASGYAVTQELSIRVSLKWAYEE